MTGYCDGKTGNDERGPRNDVTEKPTAARLADKRRLLVILRTVSRERADQTAEFVLLLLLSMAAAARISDYVDKNLITQLYHR